MIVKTFRDAINEAINYEYSTEHYESLKECAELQLMAQYFTNQEFMTERTDLASLIRDDGTHMFIESVSDDSMNILIEQFNEKVNELQVKFYGWIQKLIRTFTLLLRKIGLYIDKSMKKAAECRKMLKNIVISKDDGVKIWKHIESLMKNESTSFPAMVNQPYREKMKINMDFVGNHSSRLADYIAVALSDTYVKADVANIEDSYINVKVIRPGLIGAIDPDELIMIMAKLDSSDDKGLTDAIKHAQKAWSDAKRNGIKVFAQPKKIEENCRMMQEIIDKGTSTIIKRTNKANDGSFASKAKATAINMLGTQGVRAILSSGVGWTMKVFTTYNNYRTDMINYLYDFLKSKQESKKEES